ncbi:MAG TPA: tetratricopeptide repeat protein [Bacteroidetes bacterium]|nr:tetratricopeptide repeat protein [Bacteroidota bacterium]
MHYQLKLLLKISFLVLFLLITGLSGSLSAQETSIIKKQISETHNVEQKIALLSKLAGRYINVNPDSAMFYANQALFLAKSAEVEQYSGNIYGTLGDVLVMKDSLNLAEKYYDTALNYFEKADNFFKVAGVLTVLGNINLVKDNTSHALQYYLQALHISQENNITGRLPYLFLNIGTININANNIKEAQAYYAKALQGFEKTHDSLNIGRTLSNLGLTYQKLNDYKQANVYYKQALSIFKRLNAYADLAKIYFSLAVVERLSGSYKKAIDYLKISLQNIHKIDFNYAGPRINILAGVEVELGAHYLALGNYRAAKQHLKKGFQLADKNGLLTIARDGAENLSLLYEKQGRFDSSLYYHKILKEKSELLINEENIKKLANIEAHYKYDRLIEEQDRKRIAEAKAQRRKNIIYIVAIVILVLVALLLLLFLKLGRNKAARSKLQKKNLQNELELRNKELTTQVMTQLKKNELILEISKKLEKTLSAAHPDNKPIIERVIKELDSDESREVWKEFEVRFQNVHSDFYKNLVKKYPDLTANELRLCAFLKLNLNTKEISSITHQSVNSIDVARSRLRQKLGLSKEDNLTSFFAGF